MNILLAKAYLATSAITSGTAAHMATVVRDSEAPDWSKVTAPIEKFIDSLLWPAIGIVVAIGTLYCVLLGVKFAKAEEPQEHEKAKNHLKNAIIGFILIFVLLLALKLGYPQIKAWYTSSIAK